MRARVALLLHVQLSPHGFSRGGMARGDAPVVRKGGDEEQAPAGLGQRVGHRRAGRRLLLGAGVGHLDTDDALAQDEVKVEVPAGDMPVAYGVGGEFRRDEGECFVDVGGVGVAPVVQAV